MVTALVFFCIPLPMSALGEQLTSGYSPTTLVSLYNSKMSWGSESGIYYWDGASYRQIDGYTMTSGFVPASGFVPTGEYSPTTSVSLYDGEIAWGSESGVYYWDGSTFKKISDFGAITKGDINGDGVADLTDAVLALRALARIDASKIFRQADVNGDGKIGISEALYVFDSVAGLRSEP